MTDVKIFAMNDCDWMAAEDLESATAEYAKEYGDAEAIEDPRELTTEEMDHLIIHDAEGDNPDCTFAEGLAGMIARGVQFPTFFASTEY